MTNAASLDANAYLSLTRRSAGPLYEGKSPGFRYFNRPIRFSHLRLQSIPTNPRPKQRALPQYLKPLGIRAAQTLKFQNLLLREDGKARELRQPICVRTKFCPADFVSSLALRDGLGAGSPELVFIDSQSLYLRIERLGWDAELRCCARWAGDASVTCRKRGFDHLFFRLMQNATKRKRRASCCVGGRPLEPSLVDGKNVTVVQNDSPP